MATFAAAVPLTNDAFLDASTLFRLVRHDEDRWDVQQFSGRWHSVYSDDSAKRAFARMEVLADLSGGRIVCSRCECPLDTPKLRKDEVFCELCDALQDHAPVRALVCFGVFCVIWAALMLQGGNLIHSLVFGGARW